MNSSADVTKLAPAGAAYPVPPDLGAPDKTRVAFPERFQIVKRLGAGGMAEVFVAHRREPDGSRTPVVIKRPLAELAAHPEFLDMFLDEARIASAIVHPNVVRVLEVVREADTCLLVMELVEGKPLSSLMARIERRRQRLEARVSAHLVARAAEGLHHAHELTNAEGKSMQIVHRDVSPQNVLVSFDGDVKVIDFGIARALGRVTQTKTGTRKGKTGYMAPEQAKSGPLDRRVDVFALGILLWELLAGRRLFVRPDEYRTMNALLIDPIPLPSRFAAVPPELEEIVMRALDRDPAQRFDSADQLRAVLDAFVTSLGPLSRPELARAIRAVFPQEAILPPEDESSGAAEIGPAVISRATMAMKGPSDAPRRQVLVLGLGAIAAAGLGGLLGWAGKKLRGGSSPEVIVAAGPRQPARGGKTGVIGVEPLVRKPLPVASGQQVLVPPALPGARSAAPAGPSTEQPHPETTTSAHPPRRPGDPSRRRSTASAADLPRKKNPF